METKQLKKTTDIYYLNLFPKRVRVIDCKMLDKGK